MKDNELKTYDNLINVIITSGTIGKQLMDMLMLVARMKAAYSTLKQNQED